MDAFVNFITNHIKLGFVRNEEQFDGVWEQNAEEDIWFRRDKLTGNLEN